MPNLMMHRIEKCLPPIADKKMILYVLAAAIAVRILFGLVLGGKLNFYDTVHYDTAAQSILKGEGFGKSLYFYDKFDHYCLEPAYPIFLSIIYFIFGHSFAAVKLVQILLSVAHIYLIFLIARKIFNDRVALIVLCFSAVYPFFVFIANIVYSTQLFSFFLTLVIYCLVLFHRNQKPGWLPASAIFLGLDILTIPVVLPGVPLFIVWLYVATKGRSVKKVLYAGLYGCVVILTLLPWTIRNYVAFRQLSPGRACNEAANLLNYRVYLDEREKSLAADFFNGRTFAIYCVDNDSTVAIDCFLDDRYLVTVVIGKDRKDEKNAGYFGLALKGGGGQKIDRYRAISRRIAQNDTADVVLVDTAEELPDFIADGEVMEDRTLLFTGGHAERWFPAVFDAREGANYFEMSYTQPISPQDIRQCCFLIDMDEYDPAASGYMVWLNPWKEVDVRKIESGEPKQSVTLSNQIRYGNSNYLAATMKLILHDPVFFFVKHFVPEFAHFWSPFVSRISNQSFRASELIQWVSVVFFLPLLLLFPIGLYALRKSVVEMALLLIPVLTISTGYSIFFAEIRFRIPIDPVMIIVAMAGLDGLWRFFTGKNKP